jgi:hypothetical protein
MRLLAAGLMALALMAGSAAAETPRQVTWDDLVPPGPMLLDPSTPLSNSQRADLYKIESIREREKRGSISQVSPEYDEAVALTRKLKRQGLNVDALLTALAEFDAEIVRRNQAVVGALEGQLVRMPGYALPLEFSGGEMKEFLLVPFIGACIHVPPPPPNQVVFVKLNEGFTPKDLYTPVWITGRMTVNRASKSLSLVDGQSDVEMAYALEGVRVELYKR